MSWFRVAGSSRGGNKRQGIWEQIFSRPRARSRKRGFSQQNCRSLRIDPLEARCLLSVVPATLSAIVVNQTFGQGSDTTIAHSVASDNSGDFVVAWANASSGNVYARYFTNTEEQITLPTGTTRFSLTDNDQTIDQISIVGGTPPTGDPNAADFGPVEGTFTLWFDANGDGIQTANETLANIPYDQTNPSATATAIQTWLNGFSLYKNPATGPAVSDGSSATVNAIDADTFVVDFGTATEGLNQSSLLQYVAGSAAWSSGFQPSVAITNLDRPFTVNNIPASPSSPALTAEAISGDFQPPSVAGQQAVAPVDFPTPWQIMTPPYQTLAPYTEPVATNSVLNTTATPFVTAQPVAGANGTLSATQFDITFTGFVDGNQESTTGSGATVDAAMVVSNCVNASGAALSTTPLNLEGVPSNPPLPAMFSNSVSTANNVQQLTFAAASASPINSTFELQAGAAGTPTIPITFNSGNPASTAAGIQSALTAANLPGVTGVTVTPVASPVANNYSFQVTFSGTQPPAPLQYVAAPGATILKQSGNEFEVNPPQPNSVYTQGLQTLVSDQPAVAMDGSGGFVITWREQVPQQLAPKNITDIYFRRYLPTGQTLSFSDAAVTGEVASDIANYQQQQLTFYSTAAAGTAVSGMFELQVGPSGSPTAEIPFNGTNSTGLVATATAIQTALDVDFPGTTVSWDAADSSSSHFAFDVAFGAGEGVDSPIEYGVPYGLPTTVPATCRVTALQSYTGVRLLASPNQELTFTATAASVPLEGSFQLQVGASTTTAIAFDSNNLSATASNIQSALLAEGYAGVTVTVAASTNPGVYNFNVLFTGLGSGVDVPAILYVPGALAATVAIGYPDGNDNGALPNTTDPYTQQANVDYTNPQLNPAVAMDPYGDFVIVWANQGQDLSWFNNISMDRYDKNGNLVGYVGSVNNGTFTNIDYSPDVAIGNDGNVVVTWSETSDPNYLVDNVAFSTVYVRGFDAQSSPLWSELAVVSPKNGIGGGGNSTVAMDGQDNFVVAWEVAADSDVGVLVQTPPLVSEGIYGAEYQLENYGLPATTFTNSVVVPSKTQQLTFDAAYLPLEGTFQ